MKTMELPLSVEANGGCSSGLAPLAWYARNRPARVDYRKAVTAAKAKHGILTHHAAHLTNEEQPWLALVPMECDQGKDIMEIMAESCRIYDELNLCAYGATEREAIINLGYEVEAHTDTVSHGTKG